MKILVLCQDYPDENGCVSLYYVHIRNMFYKNHGINVSVLNKKAKQPYVIDGVQVLSYNEAIDNIKINHYDFLLCHAPNVRTHFVFLLRYRKYFKKIIFFFHGHEVLYKCKVYSQPFPWANKVHFWELFIDKAYDKFKLKLWHHYFKCIAPQCHFIFVSQWMFNEFQKWVHLPEKILNERKSIIYNGVGDAFENNTYKESLKVKYDFITIRSNFDNSKYGVDIVNELAWRHPQFKFLLIGKGDIFNHIKQAPNLEVVFKSLNAKEILEFLDLSASALMPTRTDAQGLMMCEMATYGIPLITSNIPVCREVFEGLESVYFIDNDKIDSVDLQEFVQIYRRIPNVKETKYFKNTTINLEVELFERLI